MENQPQYSDRYAHISAWGYFGYQLLFSIPIIGLIALICCSLFAHNLNLRSFARSYFCGFIIVLVLIIILVSVGGAFLASVLDEIMTMLG
jgi:hypothetical protein